MAMNKKIKINFDEIKDTDDLELIKVEIEALMSTPDHRTFVVLTDQNDKRIVELNVYESSMLAFAFKGLHLNSHIQTIHQLFCKYLKLFHASMESVTIESKVGDIIYCSLKLVDKDFKRTFAISSLCDGLLMSLINETSLFAIKTVWEQLDEYDDWDYEEYLIDFPGDED
jgi:bifunctional DNase/RNase